MINWLTSQLKFKELIMNMFSIITIIIVSISMIVIGYVAPYVTLAFYAIQRKTTIKSLQSLVNKYYK